MLAVAARTQFVAGVVGWCDFEAADAGARIARLSGNPLLVGLRPMVHDIPDANWLARPELAPAFAAMAAHDLVFDALLRPRHIAPMLSVLDRHPDLAVVIDHAAKPDLTGGDLASWRDGHQSARRPSAGRLQALRPRHRSRRRTGRRDACARWSSTCSPASGRSA